MSVNAKMKAICDNIRLRTGGTALLNLDEIAEAIMTIGKETDPIAMLYSTIGTTFPPDQLPGEAQFSGYDIDINTSLADDLHAYIDAGVQGKNTVTKELMGKDASETYDILRYTYAKREYCAWQKDKYPKMYAWKNGSTVKYTRSVSPRIDETAFAAPYVEVTTTGGGTVPNFTNLKDECTYKYNQRYSLSGGGYKTQANVTTIVVPVPTGTTSITVRLKGVSATADYSMVYGGTSTSSLTETLHEHFSTDIMSPDSNGIYTVTFTKTSGCSYASFHVVGSSASDFTNTIITVNEPIEYTTTGGTEVENGVPITAVSATNRSRTIGGVEYVRYESGDVEPTLIYTGIDDSRNANASITQGGVTYHRYPLGDLGANRKKLTPIFIYANEHGIIMAESRPEKHESKGCALIAARFLRDLANDRQADNPIYKYIRENCMVIVIPVVNPFGYNIDITGGSGINSGDNANGYVNANRCNINRNYDTPGWDATYQREVVEEGNPPAWVGHYPGSQNETQYVMNTMVESGAVVAMSLHGVGGWAGRCAHQGQSPDGSDYNQTKLNKVVEFLLDNWGYELVYYDRNEDDTPVMPPPNTPDITSKSPSYITQCGAYGGIIEFQMDDVTTSGYLVELKSNVLTNAYAQMLNLMAMWLSDYLDNR